MNIPTGKGIIPTGGSPGTGQAAAFQNQVGKLIPAAIDAEKNLAAPQPGISTDLSKDFPFFEVSIKYDQLPFNGIDPGGGLQAGVPYIVDVGGYEVYYKRAGSIPGAILEFSGGNPSGNNIIRIAPGDRIVAPFSKFGIRVMNDPSIAKGLMGSFPRVQSAGDFTTWAVNGVNGVPYVNLVISKKPDAHYYEPADIVDNRHAPVALTNPNGTSFGIAGSGFPTFSQMGQGPTNVWDSTKDFWPGNPINVQGFSRLAIIVLADSGQNGAKLATFDFLPWWGDSDGSPAGNTGFILFPAPAEQLTIVAPSASGSSGDLTQNCYMVEVVNNGHDQFAFSIANPTNGLTSYYWDVWGMR